VGVCAGDQGLDAAAGAAAVVLVTGVILLIWGVTALVRAAGSRPTLIMAGGAVGDESAAARWFRAASPATVQVWVVPHAGHTQGLITAPRAWEAHVIGFLDAALER
jgi:uncharacterized membrane protein YqiK